MNRAMPAPAPAPRARRVLRRVAAAIATLVLAFALGRWTAPSEESAPPAAVPQLEAQPPAVTYAPPPSPPAAAAPSPQIAPSAPPPAGLGADVATRLNREVKAQVEAQRERVVARCWPKSGAHRPSRASLTYNLVFDAQGREIVRGISEDRRAPAGEFTECVRQLDRMAVAVAPPGRSVGLSFTLSYP